MAELYVGAATLGRWSRHERTDELAALGYTKTERVNSEGLVWFLNPVKKPEIAPLEKTAEPVSSEKVGPVAKKKSKG